MAWLVKNLSTMQEASVQSLGGKEPLEEEMATLSCIRAWKVPWTEDPGGLQPTGLQRVGHGSVTNTFTLLKN